MINEISVIGGGAWGTSLASYFSSFASTKVYMRNTDAVFELNKDHTNSKYLPGVELSESLMATNNIDEVLESELLVIVVPSAAFGELINKLATKPLNKNAKIIIATKGLMDNPPMLFSDLLDVKLPSNNYGFLFGPNFAKEIALGKSSAATIAFKDYGIASEFAKRFSTNRFSFSPTDDIYTLQIAGIVKNIAAIYSGIIMARGDGENARAKLVTDILQEISLIAKHFGGKIETIMEPGVVGDLVLTSYSTTSRNTQFGYKWHLNNYSRDFIKESSYLVEGLRSAMVMQNFLTAWKIDAPFLSSIIKLLTAEEVKSSIDV